jgi:hypothetical protein
MPIAGQFFGTDISNSRSAGVTIEGLDAVVTRILGLPGKAKQALGHAMKAEMEQIIDVAKAYYVPYDSGQLHDSGRVRGPVFVSASVIEVIGSFGPVSNPRGSSYAVPVHEIPEPPSQSVGGYSAHHNVGTWKFLEIPFLIRQDGMVNRISAELNTLLASIGL